VRAKPIDSKRAGLHNEMKFISYLREYGAMEISKLRELSGMGFSTIVTILSRLRDKGLIKEEQGTSKKRGAKPTIISIASDARYLLGIEIKPNSLLLGIFNFNLELVDTLDVEINRDFPINKIVKVIEINLLGFLSRHNILKEKIIGTGVTLSGAISPDGTVKLSSPMGWHNIPLGKMLSEKFNFKIKVYPTRVRFLAELAKNKTLATSNVLYFNAGDGVGATFFYNGSLIYGANGLFGEMGHVVIDKNGPICGCGNRGCLEAFVSGPSIVKLAEEENIFEIQSPENNKEKREPEKSLSFLVKLASQGNKSARLIIEDTSHKIASSLAVAINLYDPDTIMLAGYVCQNLNTSIKKAFDEVLKSKVYNLSERNIEIIDASIDRNKLITGSAVALMQDTDFLH